MENSVNKETEKESNTSFLTERSTSRCNTKCCSDCERIENDLAKFGGFVIHLDL